MVNQKQNLGTVSRRFEVEILCYPKRGLGPCRIKVLAFYDDNDCHSGTLNKTNGEPEKARWVC